MRVMMECNEELKLRLCPACFYAFPVTKAVIASTVFPS
jgi:hypothetical protein